MSTMYDHDRLNQEVDFSMEQKLRAACYGSMIENQGEWSKEKFQQLNEVEARRVENTNLRIASLEARLRSVEQQLHDSTERLDAAYSEIERQQDEINILTTGGFRDTKLDSPDIQQQREAEESVLNEEDGKGSKEKVFRFRDLEDMADLVNGMLKLYESKDSKTKEEEIPESTSNNPVLCLDSLNQILTSLEQPLPPRASYRQGNHFAGPSSKSESGSEEEAIPVIVKRSPAKKTARKSPKKEERLALPSITAKPVSAVVVSRKGKSGKKQKQKLRISGVPNSLFELGPPQHALMLRQLRYVKSVMCDLPWAKGALRDMLTKYTSKEMNKEEMFPRLCHLSGQVETTLRNKSDDQRQNIIQRNRASLQLSIAQEVINDITITKHGRRGRPHASRLIYDPAHPLQLHWRSKNGQRSNQSLDLNLVKDLEMGIVTSVLKKAGKKYKMDPEACVSLVTPDRTLDLELTDSIQRDWLISALNPVIAFAKDWSIAEKKRRILRRRI